jgi:hypothetical protein
VLRFEVAADTFATFREATHRLQRSAGGGLDDDAVLLAMARLVLGGPCDEGRSSYPVSLSVCRVCGGGVQPAGGELVPVDAAIVDMATCDAQHLAELLPHTAPPWTANGNANLDSVPTDVAEGHSLDGATEPNGAQITTTRQSSNHAHVGAISRREKDASTDPSGSTAPGALPQKRAAGADGHPSPRAKQSIPPALRRAVLTRDRRCRVPGCAHSTFVELHHLILRAAGKGS